MATLKLTPGWATFGQVLPAGAAPDALQVGNLPTQTDVKTYWPDGSIRYAVVSANVPASGTYALAAAAARAGSFSPALPNTSVQLTIGGTTYTAALPTAPSNDRWLNGALVVEGRYVVTPLANGTPHPFLQVIFDVRSYSDGKSRLDVAVENVLNKVGATSVTYNVNILANGQSLFQQSNITHHYLTRWRKVFDMGLSESQVTHDFEPYYQAGALPRYLSTITNQSYSTNGATFGILGRGGNSYDYMGATGGRPEIAPYPDWTVRYLVYQSPDQYSYVMANGDLAGSWPIHIREADGSLVSIDDKPDFYLDQSDKQPWINNPPLGDLSAASLGPLTPDLAHVPSLAYVPYLVTGDRYYADEMALWGNYALVGTWCASLEDGARGGSLGIVGTEQVRARAWSLRNLVDAAAYLPDADPAKAYLNSKVENNLNYYDSYAQTHVTPLGTVLEVDLYYDGLLRIAQWQNNYLAWSIDHANQQKFTGGQAMRDRIASFQLKLFMSGPAYPREYAGPYWPIVGTDSGGVPQYFTTMAQMFQANYGSGEPPVPFEGYYGIDARLSLLTAIDQGWDGAQDAYSWLMTQIASDLNGQPGWAIAH